jgi:hypothetical protein
MWHVWGRKEMRRVLFGKPQGKRPLGRPRRRCQYDIKVDIKEIRWEGMDWIQLSRYQGEWQDLVDTVMNLRVTDAENFLTS